MNIDAPTGGWNTRDPLDSMNPNDAILMDNWYPDNGAVCLRAGYKEYADSGVSGNVRTLLNYEDTEFFAVSSNGNIYDITDASSVSTAHTGLTSPYVESIIINGNMACVNGADTPFEYDGATWSNLTLSGTGLTPADLNGVITFGGRAIYWSDQELSFWYAGAGAYTGALTEFNLGLIARRGGTVKNIFTLTHDGGDGVDDYFVILTTTGETLVYQGSDPSASSFTLVGRYLIGEPVSIRGVTQIAGDVLILTHTGWVNFQSVFNTKQLSDRVGIGGKIAPSAQQAASSYGDNDGWQVLFYPDGNKLFINVPQIEGSSYVQHVLNTNTGAWCRYKDIAAQCFGIFQNNLYFGGDGEVHQAEVGTNDNGAAIEGDCIPSFNAYGAPGNKKQLTAIQVVSNYNFPSNMGISGSGDFQLPVASVVDQPSENIPAEWDDGEWDAANWGLVDGIHATNWISLSAYGFFVTFRLILKARYQNVKWYSTNVMAKIGGMV